MVQFVLPPNSRINPNGKVHKARAGATQVRTFKIYRFDPNSGENPRVDTFEVDMKGCGPMVLDGLINDQRRDRFDADVPPFLPRRHLRLVRDEHQRRESPGLHDGDGRSWATPSRSIRCRTCRW